MTKLGVLAVASWLGVTATFAQSRADARLNDVFAQAAESQALLRLVLRKFPKGADLHNHASGGVFAEDFLAWAADKDACLTLATMTLTDAPCTAPVSVPVRGLELRDVDLYNDAIDGLSTRRHSQDVGEPTVSGHERFFRSFRRFGVASRGENARMLAVALEQADQDNNLYVELMAAPAIDSDLNALYELESWDASDMAGRLDRLLPKLTALLPLAKAATDSVEASVAESFACATNQPSAACAVTKRYLMTVSREALPAQVFGRMAWSFVVADADPRFVGVNIAQPEDGPLSLRDYTLHMQMFAFFKQRFPAVPLALHAGELTLGLTPPRDLRFHIREAVEIAGARRIGHGVDIAFEDDADLLLARMARDKIAVEINLTSNDVILGVKGSEHPLKLYLGAGVPVALSTDDSGVSRNDLTNEYWRAVTEHGLSYTNLRQISRDSLTYSFLEGESLWDADGRTLRAACKALPKQISTDCKALLESSAKAREQWRLEQAILQFEAELPALVASLSVSR